MTINMESLWQRLGRYEKLMRLDKPIGILLLLWPTLWALWLSSWGTPDWVVVWVFALGTVLMRSAGCVINDLADRKFDAHVERTRDRPLATGEVSVREALWLLLALIACAFCLVLALRNWHVVALSASAVLLAAGYPFTKRFFAVPQAWLGLAYGSCIPMAYATQFDTIPATAWVLLLANVFWSIAYDTEYAMVDRADDLRIGIRTSAITFGRFDVAAVMCCYAAAFALIAWVGRQMHARWAFYAGLGVAAALAGYHYTLIRKREPARCFKAFLHNNWVGASIFAGIVIDFLIARGTH
ncbi:MAG: 4-hydroxybenzoate octaprenyltransferase [Candidatus Accumulibacter sp.]|jgi:4-hydroxybenzoate polyprenyltransferase|nr:4-hydroxybenzoate octaprenyltransferase [Accumulibacter sp.]